MIIEELALPIFFNLLVNLLFTTTCAISFYRMVVLRINLFSEMTLPDYDILKCP